MALFLSQLIAPTSAAAKAGTKCIKLNSTTVSAGIKYTCIKSGTKLVWNKGVKVATPTPTETLRPQKITMSTAAITYQQGSLDVLLPISTEANLGYTLESQSRRICTIGRENRVNFFEVGKCIIKVSVNETSRYQANSVLFYIDVVAKPTPTPTATSEAILAGIRAAAIANNTFYLDRDYCHNRGVNAELQINEAGNWKRLVGATGWEESSSCPAEKPVKPWAAIDVPAGTTLRWRFWLSGVFDMNTATFMSLTKKVQGATASPSPTPTVKPSAIPTPTSNAAADAAAKAAADAAAKAAADAAKTIRYFTATGTRVFCTDLNPASSFVYGRVVIPRDGFTSKPSTDYRNGTVARVYSGVFYRFFDGGYGVSGTFQTWWRNSWQESWTLYVSGPWTPTVEITCSYLG